MEGKTWIEVNKEVCAVRNAVVATLLLSAVNRMAESTNDGDDAGIAEN